MILLFTQLQRPNVGYGVGRGKRGREKKKRGWRTDYVKGDKTMAMGTESGRYRWLLVSTLIRTHVMSINNRYHIHVGKRKDRKRGWMPTEGVAKANKRKGIVDNRGGSLGLGLDLTMSRVRTCTRAGYLLIRFEQQVQ